MKNEHRILIIKKCEDCPFYQEYIDRGYDDRNTSDWCEKTHKDIDIEDAGKVARFCPLKKVKKVI